MRPQPSDGFVWVQASGGVALACVALQPLASHLFTTRGWTLGSARDDDRASAWADLATAMGVAPDHLARAHQVHGAAVVVRRHGDAPPSPDLPDADVLISNDPSIALAIQTADCVPMLIADARTGTVGAAHAGWRGLAARVPLTTVEALSREFGSAPEDLIAAVGPSIRADRYEVGADVRERFEAASFGAADLERWFLPGKRPDHWFFDGWQAARDQLAVAGLRPDHIHVARLCTAEYPDLFCSYRRDGTGAGRIAGAIRSLSDKQSGRPR